jgi:N-carbamoylputrescine amidase
MTITVAAAQMRATPGDVAANLAKATALLERAADRDAGLVLLPELFNVGYFIGPELFGLWETADGRTVTWMREQANRHAMVVAGSIAERRGDRLFNALFVAEADGRLHCYSKRQPTKSELAAFDPGDEDNIAVTSLGRIGLAVCADVLWAGSLLKHLAGKVDLLLFPQASFMPRILGRLMWRREIGRGTPFIGNLVSALGAPMVQAGLIGPIQRVTRLFGSYLYGGTWITDAEGRALDNVPFDTEGLAVASIEPGSTGGDPSAKALRDPGFGHDLLDSMLVNYPNLRPLRGPPRFTE